LGKIPYKNLIHPEDWHIYAERKEKRLREEDVPSTYSVRIITRTGEVLWVQGDQESARRIWKDALRETPSDKVLLNVIERFTE